MIKREVAWRVFAHEFVNSDYFFHDGDERSPNYLVTPTGARVNRLYFVGVLTEIDNLGAGEDMWRARVSDPTGAFSVYAGQYQPQASVFLSGLDVPCFIAITGKARTYEPEDGTVYTSVRPEELNMASDRIRDRWIIDTARLTYKRIELVRSALDTGLKGDELRAMLVQSGASAELADGILSAVSHYTDLARYLSTLENVILNALKNIATAYRKPVHGTQTVEEIEGNRLIDPMVKETPARYNTEDTPAQSLQPGWYTKPGQPIKPIDYTHYTELTQPIHFQQQAHTSIQTTDFQQPVQSGKPVQHIQPENSNAIREETDNATTGSAVTEEAVPEPDEIVYELMGIMDNGNGVHVADLANESRRSGLTKEQVNEAVKSLMSEGRCYEPRLSVLRRV